MYQIHTYFSKHLCSYIFFHPQLHTNTKSWPSEKSLLQNLPPQSIVGKVMNGKKESKNNPVKMLTFITIAATTSGQGRFLTPYQQCSAHT